MSVETQIYSALKGLVNNRVYRDLAPATVTALPRITFQFVGGDAVNFVDTATLPSKRNARVQVNVWHLRRDDANTLARQVETALRQEPLLLTTVLGGLITIYEEETKLFGAMQDFSVWAEA